jgi:ribosome maturation protein SDO1
MSRQINQPINQVRLTNVAVVRFNRSGRRFEIACYRNKVMDFRAGLETDLSEVLQTDRIFTNVSKGEFAKTKDLEKAFGTHDEEAIAKIILEQGNSLQVSDLERNQQIQNTLSQIATWVANNCVHPDTCRPYTVSQIKHVLQKNYAVQTHKAIKRQYLDAVKFLKDVIPIERAKMELSLQYARGEESMVEEGLKDIPHRLIKESNDSATQSSVFILQVDPSMYRALDELASRLQSGKLEILQQVVTQQGNVELEQELHSNTTDGTFENSRKGLQTSIAEYSSSDEEAAELVDKIEEIRLRTHGVSRAGEDERYSSTKDVLQGNDGSSRRGSQRKAQKKNKKAQRRDRDELFANVGRLQEKGAQEQPVEKELENPAIQTNVAGNSTEGKPCNTCGGHFANASSYRAHFRSDWHRFNQKLKLKGISAVSEEEFLLCDSDAFFGNGFNDNL